MGKPLSPHPTASSMLFAECCTPEEGGSRSCSSRDKSDISRGGCRVHLLFLDPSGTRNLLLAGDESLNDSCLLAGDTKTNEV